ncbi:Hypothetical protein R9X50_00186900 [Acrodontium crateriforme]|uniref:Uncharacterized protein n=1 Tax=Acrodontium crateriforme TaxID=150365 RepID=A0AAQ3M037_9PEZI|nr:Hypothetical protein R9X50_00186900 [Acrodontium crateriforme]
MPSEPINPKPSPLQDRDRALRRREKRWRRQKQSAELRAKWTYARNFNYFDDETCDGLREVNAQRERKEHFNSMSVRRIQAKAIVREAARRSLPVDLKDDNLRLTLRHKRTGRKKSTSPLRRSDSTTQTGREVESEIETCEEKE